MGFEWYIQVVKQIQKQKQDKKIDVEAEAWRSQWRQYTEKSRNNVSINPGGSLCTVTINFLTKILYIFRSLHKSAHAS